MCNTEDRERYAGQETGGFIRLGRTEGFGVHNRLEGRMGIWNRAEGWGAWREAEKEYDRVKRVVGAHGDSP